VEPAHRGTVKCSLRKGYGLIRNYQTSPIKLANEKHSSLICPTVCDEEKTFISLTPTPNLLENSKHPFEGQG